MHDRFRLNRALAEPQASKEIAQAREVAKILLENIVQGKQVEDKGDGNLYSKFPSLSSFLYALRVEGMGS